MKKTVTMRRSASPLNSLPKTKAAFIEPMECSLVSKLPEGANWTYEIKLDGYRAIAVKSGQTINLFSRRGKLFNSQYPYLVEALADLPEGTVVDGEVVALDDAGRPIFNLLQQFRSEASRICYFIFDLLICNDRDLTKLPLVERRRLLKSLKLAYCCTHIVSQPRRDESKVCLGTH
jgi:bifunctional non-homologous end joining protein LigD